MGLALVLSLVLGGVAIALVVRAASMPRARANRQLGQIAAYGYATESIVVEQGDATVTGVARIAGVFGRTVEGRIGDARREQLSRLLLSAGIYDTDPIVFTGYRVLASMGLALLVALMTSSTSWSPVVILLAIAYATAMGWMVPLILLRARGNRRLERIDRTLPELIDLLVIAVEAGQGLNGALRMAGDRVKGPLGQELAIVLREQDLGITNMQSLENLMRRCETVSVRAFVRAVTQGERLGVSIGQVLRGQAQEARTRRRQGVEEKAQKAPIKILFPLAFLIFPALFIVVLYPGVHNFLQALS